MNGFIKKRLTFTGADSITFDTAATEVSLALISGGPVAFSLTGKTLSDTTDDEALLLTGDIPVFFTENPTTLITLYCADASEIQVDAR